MFVVYLYSSIIVLARNIEILLTRFCHCITYNYTYTLDPICLKQNEIKEEKLFFCKIYPSSNVSYVKFASIQC